MTPIVRTPVAGAGPGSSHLGDWPGDERKGGQETLGNILLHVVLQRQQCLVLLQGRQPPGGQGI